MKKPLFIAILLFSGLALVTGCKEKDFAKSKEKAQQAAEAAKVATTQAIEDAKPYVEDIKKEAAEVAEKVKTATTQAAETIREEIDDFRGQVPSTQPAEEDKEKADDKDESSEKKE